MNATETLTAVKHHDCASLEIRWTDGHVALAVP
jgi:hypothetical protein